MRGCGDSCTVYSGEPPSVGKNGLKQCAHGVVGVGACFLCMKIRCNVSDMCLAMQNARYVGIVCTIHLLFPIGEILVTRLHVEEVALLSVEGDAICKIHLRPLKQFSFI